MCIDYQETNNSIVATLIAADLQIGSLPTNAPPSQTRGLGDAGGYVLSFLSFVSYCRIIGLSRSPVKRLTKPPGEVDPGQTGGLPPDKTSFYSVMISLVSLSVVGSGPD